MEKAFVNWSGGKDCTLALHTVLQEKKYSVEFLFTSLSRQFQRVSMHGVRKEMITRQAMALGIHSRKLYLPEQTDMSIYDQFMQNEMLLMKERGITNSVFGDIFLEDLRKYREEKLQALSIKAHFPLWKKDTTLLLKQFIDLGYRSIIVSIDKQKLDERFLGQTLSYDLINELPSGVDPCGENGEFHTFVYSGPIFSEEIKIQKSEIVRKNYTHEGKIFEYAFLDILPQN
jgi:uncharacterized protein (TIGR00290 family)